MNDQQIDKHIETILEKDLISPALIEHLKPIVKKIFYDGKAEGLKEALGIIKK